MTPIQDRTNAYFSCFQTLANFRNNSITTSALAVLGILSYLTVLIPACVGMRMLYGRIRKKSEPFPEAINTKKISAISQTAINPPTPSPINSSFVSPSTLPAIDASKSLAELPANKNRTKYLFNASWPGFLDYSKKDMQILLNDKIKKLENFLNNPTINTRIQGIELPDIVHVCMGPGGRFDQALPGFFFDAFKKKQLVKTLIFTEIGAPMMATTNERNGIGNFFNNIWQLYLNYYNFHKLSEQTESQTSLLEYVTTKDAFHHFTCGYPTRQKTVDTLTGDDKDNYKFILNLFWPNKEQQETIKKNFELYLEKELQAGNTVVFGEYRGCLDEEITTVYNRLLKTYPGQVYLLWRWEALNVRTSKDIQKMDIDPRNPSLSKWEHLKPSGEDCLLVPPPPLQV